MTLNQIAQQAMDYLDSVGVAADYDIERDIVTIETDEHLFWAGKTSGNKLIAKLESTYPQKSPA